jgi:K+-sensing histidine kinase KdpD
MVWHLLGASTLLAVLKWRRIAGILQDHAGLRTQRFMGFAFATVYALLTIPFSATLIGAEPMPRFNDIFLIGITLTAYFFTWEPAAYLLVLSVLASAWILPPYGTLRVEGFTEWYRLISFTAVSLFIMLLLTRMKRRVAEVRSATASGD